MCKESGAIFSEPASPGHCKEFTHYSTIAATSVSQPVRKKPADDAAQGFCQALSKALKLVVSELLLLPDVIKA